MSEIGALFYSNMWEYKFKLKLMNLAIIYIYIYTGKCI